MRLRQIALAASDLAATTAALSDVLGAGAPFRDPGVAVFGLDNAVMPIGETFLEVVSPVRDDATAKRWIAKRGGDAGYMVIVQCDDLATLAREVERAKRAGAVVVWEGEHAGARTAHFHPRELGAIASLDGMPSWGDWVWAGPGLARAHAHRDGQRDHGCRARGSRPGEARSALERSARNSAAARRRSLRDRAAARRADLVRRGRRGRRARRCGDRARRPRALRSPRTRARRARRGWRRDDRRRSFHSRR